MSSQFGDVPRGGLAALVPELLVSDMTASRHFWCDLLGFKVAYERPPGFAYIELDGAHVMLCKRNGVWETGSMEKPLGQGINFQISVRKVDEIFAILSSAGWPIYVEPMISWYRAGPVELGQKEFLVQDPDGFLVRLAESLGRRPAATA